MSQDFFEPSQKQDIAIPTLERFIQTDDSVKVEEVVQIRVCEGHRAMKDPDVFEMVEVLKDGGREVELEMQVQKLKELNKTLFKNLI